MAAYGNIKVHIAECVYDAGVPYGGYSNFERCTDGTGSPLPGSAIPTVGHWGGLGLGLGLRIGLGLGLGLGVRVRRTVGMADPGNGGPWEWRTGITDTSDPRHFGPKTVRH